MSTSHQHQQAAAGSRRDRDGVCLKKIQLRSERGLHVQPPPPYAENPAAEATSNVTLTIRLKKPLKAGRTSKSTKAQKSTRDERENAETTNNMKNTGDSPTLTRTPSPGDSPTLPGSHRRNKSDPTSTSGSGKSEAATLQRQLVIFQQDEARALLRSKDYSSADPVIRDILGSKNITDDERRFWQIRRATVAQMLGRWKESADILADITNASPESDENSDDEDDVCRGQCLRMTAEARFQMGEYEAARDIGSQALELLEPNIDVEATDSIDAKSEFYCCIELMARNAEASGRTVEARFYRSKCTKGYIDAAALEQQRRTELEKVQKKKADEEAVAVINDILKNLSLNYKDGKIDGKNDMVFMDVFRNAIKDGDYRVADALMLDKTITMRKDTEGRTALYLAVRHGSAKYVEALLARGTDVNLPYPGNPPGYTSLIDDPDQVLNSYHRLLDVVVSLSAFESYSNYYEIAKLLLDKGADVNSKGSYRPPLVMAAKTGPQDLVKLLLDRGADVSLRGGTAGNMPLHYAADREDGATLISMLCEKKADVEARNAQGRTPLHAAARAGEVKNMTALCRHGADVNAKDYQARTPLHHAVFKRSGDAVQFLCEKGADLDARNDRNCSPLHFAAEDGYAEIAGLLCVHRADVNARTGDMERTPLHIAAEKGFVEVASVLLRMGADPNPVNKKGDTPLDRARRASDMEKADTRDVMKLLSKNGAKFKTTPKFKRMFKY